MKAEDFVRQKYPKAKVERYEWGANLVKSLREVYYLCWSEPHGTRLSEGKSASNAWSNAKKNILENEQIRAS
jgi:hypothetical protein